MSAGTAIPGSMRCWTRSSRRSMGRSESSSIRRSIGSSCSRTPASCRSSTTPCRRRGAPRSRASSWPPSGGGTWIRSGRRSPGTSRLTPGHGRGPIMKIVEAGEARSPGAAIAAVNMAVTYDKAANADKYERCLEIAAGRGARLVVFPEQSLQGYLWDPRSYWTLPPEQFEHHFALAEPVPGEITQRLTRLAAKLNLYTVIGLTERNDGYAAGLGTLFNSAVLIGPEGIIGVHRKVHTPGGEKHIYAAGWEYYGHSRIIHPAGVVVAEGGFEETIVIAHGLDIRGEILRTRTSYFFGDNFLFDRRPDVYHAVVDAGPMHGRSGGTS